jgi:hypothetical protein
MGNDATGVLNQLSGINLIRDRDLPPVSLLTAVIVHGSQRLGQVRPPVAIPVES